MAQVSSTQAKAETQQELVITRVLNAPRTMVWKALTEPERVKRWWGPLDFTSPTVKIDLRVGGKYLFCMRSPQGRESWDAGVYREIVPNEKLVLEDHLADAQGNPVSQADNGNPADWPSEFVFTILLKDVNGKTELTIRQRGVVPGEFEQLARLAWNSQVDKLAASLQEMEPQAK